MCSPNTCQCTRLINENISVTKKDLLHGWIYHENPKTFFPHAMRKTKWQRPLKVSSYTHDQLPQNIGDTIHDLGSNCGTMDVVHLSWLREHWFEYCLVLGYYSSLSYSFSISLSKNIYLCPCSECLTYTPALCQIYLYQGGCRVRTKLFSPNYFTVQI